MAVPMPTGVTTMSLDEIVQALKSRAGFDVMFPEGPRKEKIIEFVSRLTGPLPDAYDIVGAGVYLETMRVLGEKAKLAILGMEEDGRPLPEAATFDWNKVPRHVLLRGIEDLTVSMGRGKGRKEGESMSKVATMVPPNRSRWRWGGGD